MVSNQVAAVGALILVIFTVLPMLAVCAAGYAGLWLAFGWEAAAGGLPRSAPVFVVP